MGGMPWQMKTRSLQLKKRLLIYGGLRIARKAAVYIQENKIIEKSISGGLKWIIQP